MSSEVERLVVARQHWLRVDMVGLVLWFVRCQGVLSPGCGGCPGWW